MFAHSHRLGNRASLAASMVSYVTAGRVVDYGAIGEFTIADQSGNGLNAALMTGIYASADGVADKLLNADCTGLGAGTYYLTGKINPESTTAKQTLDGGSTASNLSGLTVGIWQSFQTPDFTGTPSGVTLGWDGTDFGAAGYSEVSIHDASTGEVLAPWQLNDSPAADLDGVLAADQFGNYNGSHIGGAAGTGEGSILQVANIPASTPWFDGSTSYINTDVAAVQATTTEEFEFEYYKTENEAPKSDEFAFGDFDRRIGFGWSGDKLIIECAGAGFRTTTGEYVTYNKVTKLKYVINVGVSTEFWVNDVLVETQGALSPLSPAGNYNLGASIPNPEKFAGMILSAKYTRDGVVIWDQSDGGTEVGTFSTLAAQSATILQMGRMDFNVYPVFNGVDSQVSSSLDTSLMSSVNLSAFVSITNSDGKLFGGITNQSAGFYDYGSSDPIFQNASADDVLIDGVSFGSEITRGQLHDLLSGGDIHYLEFVGLNISSWTGFNIGRDGSGGLRRIKGIVSNVKIDGELEWLGYGDNPYEDLIGSANGTKLGTFADQYVPESTVAGTDVFGNPIQFRRPNSSVINLTAEDSHVETPDSALLDTIKTAAGWLYYDGTDAVFIDFGTPQLEIVSGEIVATGFTDAAYYVDAVESSTLGAPGWYHVMVTSTAALDCDYILASGFSQGDWKFYDDVKTAPDALTNRNATKSKYL